ncbi:MAG: GH116 family glycosyl hydrolase [Kiritimatiellia bacterium]
MALLGRARPGRALGEDRRRGPGLRLRGQLGFDHVCFSDQSLAPEYVLFDDFERSTYAPWTTTGTAFGSGPVRMVDIPSYQGNVKGFGERVVNSHASAPGANVTEKDAATGTLVSPDFTLTHGYLHFLQGGGSTTAEVRVRLLRASDNTQLRIQTGNDGNAMAWRTWDVRDLRGQSVKISIEDLRTGGWGNVGVDQIVFSTNPAAPPATTDPGNVVDRGTIGIAELGTAAGRISAADHVSDAFPWLAGKSADTGGIGRTLTLAPGEAATVRFVVAWHFPILPSGLPGSRREYANRFADAFAVADHVATNFSRLAGDTREWAATWKDSSLPHWLLDRALATACTLATANCFWFSTGRFYGNEGVNCCAGTCGHVWYYAQTIARLFPDLERGTRRNVDLNTAVALTSSGAVKFRGEYNNDWAWDGQCGVVLRCYREHLGSPDTAFLADAWPNIKKVLDFLIAEDADNDGVSEARQHNTLDANWYGRVPEHIGLYAAALKAGRNMAAAMGDSAYAASCDALASAATARLAERFVNSPDFGDGYYTQQLAANTGELGHAEGCYIDQVMGEFYARMTGLERVTDPAQCAAALRSLWRFNYSHNLTSFLSSTAVTQGRIYQMPGEAGLLICTFPNDGNQWSGWQSMYFAECMSGFEYQAGAHCLAEGLLDEGLTILRAVSDRYHPAKRNPFNEIECSDHYARAMSSYGAFITACGFRHNGPEGLVAFAPALGADDFKAAFTTAEGWGAYRRIRQGRQTIETLQLKRGLLRLRTFECLPPPDTAGFLARALHTDAATPATFTLADGVLRCTLPSDLTLAEGDRFQILLFTSTLPAATDTDDDGLTDLEESSGIDDPATPADPRGHVTRPDAPDTDGDSSPDGVEARLGTDPLAPGGIFN